MIQTSPTYICTYVYVYFIYTHLHSHFGSPCAHMCIHMRIRTNFPPDATEVGCTVPTSGPLPRQPKLTLGFQVILFVDTAVFPNSVSRIVSRIILETHSGNGVSNGNHDGKPGFPTGIPLETPFPECVSKMFLETLVGNGGWKRQNTQCVSLFSDETQIDNES